MPGVSTFIVEVHMQNSMVRRRLDCGFSSHLCLLIPCSLRIFEVGTQSLEVEEVMSLSSDLK